ncbi:MAG TPA: DEAD/DEAH box helicase [Clostridiales bacterium]|nr:DEAD/DEAH box helicase [Clostridiales bacterium]HQP69314.1 DEAD/DEAH box helicase [Clostridiales bacterium]
MTNTIKSEVSPLNENSPFKQLNIIEPILRAIAVEGYKTPTPIQVRSIPVCLKGRDLLGCAQTGTGKTAAFAVPILQLLSERKHEGKRKIRSLILTPTRELAIQIGDSFKAYGRYTKLKTAVIFGGVNQYPQTQILKDGIDILIATPGRLLDLMNQKFISLQDIEIFVLDEADRMLDMGFIHDIRKVLAVLPKKRQSLFFSATMPDEIIKLAGTILNDPSHVSVTPISSTVDTIDQYVYFVDKANKSALLIDILKNKEIKTALVFTRTKHGADKVVKILQKNNITAEAIHGNKAQNARQRALNNFKDQSTRVLVATDIAARGIDVNDLEYVINYEISNIAEMYVHRIGRTGRAGARGTSYSFCDIEERPYLRDIEKLISKKIPVVEDHPYPFTGVTPVPVSAKELPRKVAERKLSESVQNKRPAHRSPDRFKHKPAEIKEPKTVEYRRKPKYNSV